MLVVHNEIIHFVNIISSAILLLFLVLPIALNFIPFLLACLVLQ